MLHHAAPARLQRSIIGEWMARPQCESNSQKKILNLTIEQPHQGTAEVPEEPCRKLIGWEVLCGYRGGAWQNLLNLRLSHRHDRGVEVAGIAEAINLQAESHQWGSEGKGNSVWKVCQATDCSWWARRSEQDGLKDPRNWLCVGCKRLSANYRWGWELRAAGDVHQWWECIA